MLFEQREQIYKDLLKQLEETRPSSISVAVATVMANKERYKKLEDKLGIPWDFIGVLHYRESNCNFTKHLHNGDSLNRRTRRVPSGRPLVGSPPFTWEESAEDALRQKGFEKIKDWTLERICYEAERYNGFGYATKKRISPYLWAGTGHYSSGKYIADGVYDKNHIDQQLGVIPILLRIRKQAVPNDVVADSRKLSLLKRARNAIVATFSGIFTVDNLNLATDYMTRIKQFAADNAIWLVLGTGASVWIVFKVIEHMTVQDFNEGRYIPSRSSDKDYE